MERIHDIWERLQHANRYVVAAALFLLWMLTLADVDLVRMVHTHAERTDIETRMDEHRARIATLEADLGQLTEDPSAKERHAREAYYMHKPNEDVFVYR